MTPKEIFEEQIAKRFEDPEKAEAAKELDAIYQFHVTGDDGGDWVVNTREAKVETGTRDDADCSITIADDDFVGLVKGDANGPQLFMMGKLQIAGNMGLAMKLGQVLGT